MTEQQLPPPCPNCLNPTTFKEMHKLAASDGFMCFFWCKACELEYPLAVGSAEIALTGLSETPPKTPGSGSDPLGQSGE